MDVQEKLYEEIKLTLNNDFSKLSHENLNSMKYLDQVIKEMLRFRSPVPLIERVLEEDFKLGRFYGHIILIKAINDRRIC